MQKIPDAYPEVSSICFNFHEVWEQKTHPGVPVSIMALDIALKGCDLNSTLNNWHCMEWPNEWVLMVSD